MKNARVLVVQKQHRFDHSTGTLVSKYDLDPARAFGEISYLLGPTAAPFSSAPIITELREKLKDYDGDSDFLLLIGNPCLIGWAVALAAANSGGVVSLLQWSGREQRYLPIRAQNLLSGD